MTAAFEIFLDILNPVLGTFWFFRAIRNNNSEAAWAWAMYTATYIVFAINYKNF